MEKNGIYQLDDPLELVQLYIVLKKEFLLKILNFLRGKVL